MQGLQIVSTGRALPKKCLTNDDLSHMVETNDEWIRTRTGIRQRYQCEEESCQSLAIAAAKDAYAKAAGQNNLTDEIGLVIVATATPTYAFPSTACMVKEALQLPEEVMAFDISAACSGFLYGLKIVQSLLQTMKKRYAILIGSEQMTKIVDFMDRTTCVLFGDGAGAAILELSDGMFFHRAWSKGDDNALYCEGVGSKEMYLHMDGSSIFRFAVKVIQEGIQAVLEDSGLTMDDIDYVVCHQANERIIDHVRKKYPGNEEKFYLNIANYANTSAASIPIALDEMYEKHLLSPGKIIITVGFGAGFTWSSALLTV